jgi:hypothetical protein
MATSANVTATLIIKGQDQASAQIDKSSKAAERLSNNLKHASDNAGKFNHGLPGLEGKHDSFNRLAGAVGGAGGALQEATHSVALLDAAMRLVPGPIGAAVSLLGATAAALVLVERHAMQAKLALAQAFSGQVLKDVTAIKESFDLTTESALALGNALADSGKTAGDVQSDLLGVANRAAEIGEDGSAAIQKFAGTLTAGVDAADKLRNRLRLLGVEVSKIDFASALSGAGLEGAGKGAADSEALLGNLSKTLDKENAKLQDLIRNRQGPIAELKEQSNSIAFALFGGGKEGTRARGQQKEAISAQLAQVQAAKDAITALEKRQQSALAAVKQAGEAEREIKVQDAEREIQDADDLNDKLLKREQDAEKQRASAKAKKRRDEEKRLTEMALREAARRVSEVQKMEERALGIAANAEQNPARKALLQQQQIELEKTRELAEVKANLYLTTAQQAKLSAAIEVEAAGRVSAVQRDLAQKQSDAVQKLQDRVLGIYATAEQDPARKALLQQQQIEIDKTRELAEVKANLYLTSAQQAQLAAAIEVEAANKVAAAQREVTSAQYQQVQAYLQAGDAIANALLQGDAATRASAGLKALMAGAESFYQFSLGNIPGGIAAGAAAVQFARAALTSTPPTAQGSAAQAPAREPAQADRQGGSSLVVNLYGIATSKAEVGVNLQKAIKAALPTGMVPA